MWSPFFSFLFFSLLWFVGVAPYSISKVRLMSQEPSLEWCKSHWSTLIAPSASLPGICRESCVTKILVSAKMLQCRSLSPCCCACREEHGESSTLLFLSAKTGEGLCSIFSPSFVQWDAMTFFSESVISQMFRTLDKDVCVSDALDCSPGLFWVDMSGFFQLCCPWKVCSNWLPPCKTPHCLVSGSHEEYWPFFRWDQTHTGLLSGMSWFWILCHEKSQESAQVACFNIVRC